MSKSLGNFFTVRDLLDGGNAGEVIRFVMLSTHYRKPMDWTQAKADEARDILWDWRMLTRDMQPAAAPDPRVVEAVANDLNTPGAIAVLHGLRDDPALLLASARFIGLLQEGDDGWMTADLNVLDSLAEYRGIDDVLARIQARFDDIRADAMQSKDFSRVDYLKSALTDAGLEVRMSKAGVELILRPGTNQQRVVSIADELA